MKTILEANLNVSNELRLALGQGKGRLFIEGKMDAFWGAGMPYHVAVHTNPKQLRGENHMGKLLDLLRDNMINNSYIAPPPIWRPNPSSEIKGHLNTTRRYRKIISISTARRHNRSSTFVNGENLSCRTINKYDRTTSTSRNYQPDNNEV